VAFVFLPVGIIASYVVTAMVFASLGFVVNGVLSATKVSRLYNRLDHVETLYQRQMVLLSEMATLVRQMSGQVASGAAQLPGTEALAQLERLMTLSMAPPCPEPACRRWTIWPLLRVFAESCVLPLAILLQMGYIITRATGTVSQNRSTAIAYPGRNPNTMKGRFADLC
jgi:hypothetical protein